MNFFTRCLLFVAALNLDLSLVRRGQVAGMRLEETEAEDSHWKRLPFVVRDKRSGSYYVPEFISSCIMVTSEEGKYYFKAYGESDTVCGVYFLTDPDKIIEIHFEYLDVPCETGGRVSMVDGWELDGEYFPSLEDYRRPFESRYFEFCGARRLKEKKTMITSQNAGLVQYRVPKKDGAFSFTVRFLKTNRPCNILNEGKSEVYTLRNYGKASNCSFIAVSPSKVKILSMSVGIVGPSSPFEVETGSLHKCSGKGMKDLVLIGGNEGLDTAKMTPVLDTCGLDSVPQNYDVVIACNMTTVKLISSGEFDNSVTFTISPVDEEDLMETSLICGP